MAQYVALMFSTCSGKMRPGAASVAVATIAGQSRAADNRVGKGTVEGYGYPPPGPHRPSAWVPYSCLPDNFAV